MKLNPGDTIVTAYAQHASGPGWANQPVWVIVRDRSGDLREECIQPADQGHRTYVLYPVAAAMHRAFVSAIENDMEADDVRYKPHPYNRHLYT